MGYTISYKGDNSGRRAINDFIRYVGLRRAKVLFRLCRNARVYGQLDEFNFYSSFAGVQGEPVRRVIAHYHGESKLAIWCNEPNGSQRVIADCLYQ